ncbi:hypothetical protein D3C72_2390030 [compost metagenome]
MCLLGCDPESKLGILRRMLQLHGRYCCCELAPLVALAFARLQDVEQNFESYHHLTPRNLSLLSSSIELFV